MRSSSFMQVPIGFRLVSLVCVGVIFAFGVFTAMIGGDAISGKIENDHYYVRMGSSYNEVSFGVYFISSVFSLVVSIAFFVLGIRVLRVLEELGLFQQRRLFRWWVTLFLLITLGGLALCAVSAAIRSLGVKFNIHPTG